MKSGIFEPIKNFRQYWPWSIIQEYLQQIARIVSTYKMQNAKDSGSLQSSQSTAKPGLQTIKELLCLVEYSRSFWRAEIEAKLKLYLEQLELFKQFI